MGWGWSGARQSLSRRTTALGAVQDLPQHPDPHPSAPSTAPGVLGNLPAPRSRHCSARGSISHPGVPDSLDGGHRHGADVARPLGTLRHCRCAHSHEPVRSAGKAALIQLCPAPAPPSSSAPADPRVTTHAPSSAALRGWDLPAAAWERQEKAARRLSPSQVSWCASGTGTLRLDFFCEMLNIWSPALQGSLCAAGKLSAIKQHLFLRASRRGGGKERGRETTPAGGGTAATSPLSPGFSTLTGVCHAVRGAGSSLQPQPRPCRDLSAL